MTQTISGYLIDKREYEALVDIGKRLAAGETELGLVERQDLSGLVAMVLARAQSIVIMLENGLTETPPPPGEDDD